MDTKVERKKIIETLKAVKPLLRKRYGVKRLALFGSAVRDDFKETSDVDILVELEKPLGLEFVELGEFLSKVLNRKVDLVTPNMVKNPLVAKSIKEDLKYV